MVLDSAASTNGWTDAMLQAGADEAVHFGIAFMVRDGWTDALLRAQTEVALVGVKGEAGATLQAATVAHVIVVPAVLYLLHPREGELFSKAMPS